MTKTRVVGKRHPERDQIVWGWSYEPPGYEPPGYESTAQRMGRESAEAGNREVLRVFCGGEPLRKLVGVTSQKEYGLWPGWVCGRSALVPRNIRNLVGK